MENNTILFIIGSGNKSEELRARFELKIVAAGFVESIFRDHLAF